MTRRTGLGKGLEALIPGSASNQFESNFTSIPIDNITANPRQPRSNLDTDDLTELAASIKEHGILQPLIVCKEPGGDHYTLIAGERRLRAAIIAGLETVPVVFRQVTDMERLELALIENIQRSDLSPLDTAEAYQQLNDEFGLSHESIAEQVGKSRASITNNLRLLKLSDSVKTALAKREITEGHARALLALPNSQSQIAALQTILRADLSVRQTEDLVQRLNGDRQSHSLKPPKQVTPEINAIEERLRDHLGTKVNLIHGKRGGRVVIHYYSEEELNTILTQILKE